MTPSHLIHAVGNTVLAILLCIAIAVPIGTSAAILIFRSNVAGRRWAGLLLASQLAVPLYVFAGGWSAGVGLQGWMQIAQWLGPTGIVWMQGWFGRLLAVSLIHALAAIPWCCLITGLGLMHSMRSVEEAALLEGGWNSLVRHVWVPRLRIWIIAACLWCTFVLMTEMVVSNLFMFGTIAELVYLDFSRQISSPWTYLAATGLCFVPLLTAGYFVFGRLPRLQWILTMPQYHGATVLSLGPWRLPVSMMLWTVLVILVGLPILNLVVKAGWTPQLGKGGVVGYNWAAERFAVTCIESITLFRSEYYWSFTLGVCSSVVATIVAVVMYCGTWLIGGAINHHALSDVVVLESSPASDSLHFRANPYRGLVHLAMLVAIAIPGPLVGVLVAFALNRSWPEWIGQVYTTTLAAPILAQQFRLLPFGWLLACAIMASIPYKSWEMAKVDGLSSLQMLRFVVWPQTWPKWVSMLILLTLLSVGELSCSIGVLPPGVTTTSMRLFEMLHFGMRHQDSGICGILVLFGWAASLSLAWAIKARA